MTEATEIPRCGAKTDHFRLTCDRPDGHVRSASPDDWHEAASSTEQRQETQDWTLIATHEERVRWAPHPWDIPRAAPSEAL